ncbi:MAG: CDP-alcohol phosphatidyltransferase family protein [Coriobacteriia bacterium]|nr:CDP-alcohol phosphatidyltransferase family protein [Coriobacteriia bacterium]
MVEASREPDASGEVVHGNVYSVANLITVLRLVLVPFFFAALVSDSPRSYTIAVFLYAIAASTDWVDGYIARRTHTVTQLGKIIDPLVDRLLLASGVVGLYLVGKLPLWIPVALVLRDVYLLYGSYVLERNGTILPVTYIGKVTTALLMAGFTLLIASGIYPVLECAGDWFVYVGMVLSATTAIIYTGQAHRALKKVRAQ